MALTRPFEAEMVGNFGSMFGSQGAYNLTEHTFRLTEVHGVNINATGLYWGLVETVGVNPPIGGEVLYQPIWVPANTVFSWQPFSGQWPTDGAFNWLWWVVNDPTLTLAGTQPLYTPIASKFYVNTNCWFVAT